MSAAVVHAVTCIMHMRQPRTNCSSETLQILYTLEPLLVQCVADWCLLQLFMLFLAHAHGSRYQTAPQLASIPTNRPNEHAFRRPAGSPTLFLDGSWWSYWPCLIPWLLLEAANTVAWLSNSTWGKGTLAACKAAP